MRETLPEFSSGTDSVKATDEGSSGSRFGPRDLARGLCSSVASVDFASVVLYLLTLG
jgi:hypothetical protein